MRFKRLLLPAMLLALVVPATAEAKFSVGISENEPSVFSDPLFQPLKVKRTRLVTSWNVVPHNSGGDDELDRVTRYMAAAAASRTEVLVSFDHGRGLYTACLKRGKRTSNSKKNQCRLPSVSEYTRAVSAFMDRFPQVKVVSPWNEANHFSQPTYLSPTRAAAYTKAVDKLCKQKKRGCTIVAMDLLDQPNSASSRTVSYSKTISYTKRFRKALGSKFKRNVCGVHNYSDINRKRTTGTRAIMSAAGCKSYWLTETGGIYKFGKTYKSSQSRQTTALKYLFKYAKAQTKVKRVYVYNWFGGDSRFDSGLVNNGRARSALKEVKRHL